MRFRRMLSVWSCTNPLKLVGKLAIPVKSTINTRIDTSEPSHVGMARSGLEPMFSSSRFVHAARAGGNEGRKFADISRASRVSLMSGSMVARKMGRRLGVAEAPRSKWVVPVRGTKSQRGFSWSTLLHVPWGTSSLSVSTPSPRTMCPLPSSARTTAAVRSGSSSYTSSSSVVIPPS